LQESKRPGRISDRRAGQLAKHPGENLQRCGLDETWAQVMEGDVGLLIGDERGMFVGKLWGLLIGELWGLLIGQLGECWLKSKWDC